MGAAAATAKAEKAVALVDLPPFPAIAIKALQLVSNSDARLRELHHLISADPALSTGILRMANSPLYAIHAEIQSTLQAAILMGFERVRALVLTIAMKSYVGGSLVDPTMRLCWRHSIACAMIAEEFALATFLDKDTAYTAGLMHDIGRLALVVLRPVQYGEILKKVALEGSDLLVEEKTTFGFDHCQAGQALVAAWNLPQHFALIAGEHHIESKRQLKPLGILQAVAIACAIADVTGFEVLRPVNATPYDALLRYVPPDRRDRFPVDPLELTKRISDKIELIEMP